MFPFASMLVAQGGTPAIFVGAFTAQTQVPIVYPSGAVVGDLAVAVGVAGFSASSAWGSGWTTIDEPWDNYGYHHFVAWKVLAAGDLTTPITPPQLLGGSPYVVLVYRGPTTLTQKNTKDILYGATPTPDQVAVNGFVPSSITKGAVAFCCDRSCNFQDLDSASERAEVAYTYYSQTASDLLYYSGGGLVWRGGATATSRHSSLYELT